MPTSQHGKRTRSTPVTPPTLCDSDVIDIVSEYQRGSISQRTLARQYRVSQNAISQIVTGKTWSHVTGIAMGGVRDGS